MDGWVDRDPIRSHSFIHSLFHSFALSFTHSFTQSFSSIHSIPFRSVHLYLYLFVRNGTDRYPHPHPHQRRFTPLHSLSLTLLSFFLSFLTYHLKVYFCRPSVRTSYVCSSVLVRTRQDKTRSDKIRQDKIEYEKGKRKRKRKRKE